jgi:hypothetical protein
VVSNLARWYRQLFFICLYDIKHESGLGGSWILPIYLQIWQKISVSSSETFFNRKKFNTSFHLRNQLLRTVLNNTQAMTIGFPTNYEFRDYLIKLSFPSMTISFVLFFFEFIVEMSQFGLNCQKFNNRKLSRWTLCSISWVQIIAICCYSNKQTTLMNKGIIII